jgi:hypothetical protein
MKTKKIDGSPNAKIEKEIVTRTRVYLLLFDTIRITHTTLSIVCGKQSQKTPKNHACMQENGQNGENTCRMQIHVHH